MSYDHSHRLFFWRLLARRERCRAIIPYQFIRNFLLGLTPPLPGSLLATLAFFRSKLSNPVPVTPGVLGNPYAAADSNDDSIPPLPSSLLATLAFYDPSYPIHPQPSTSCHPPPPDLYQSRQAYWGTRTPPPIVTTTATTTTTTCQPPSLIGKRSTCSVWCCHLPLRTVFPPHFCSATEQTCGGCSIHFCH
jgi:hypothetical protein